MSFYLRLIAACVLWPLLALAKDGVNGSHATTTQSNRNGTSHISDIPSLSVGNKATLFNATSTPWTSAPTSTSSGPNISTAGISGSFPLPTPGVLITLDPAAACDKRWSSYQRSSILAYKAIAERTFTQVVISTETVYSTTYTCSSTCGSVCYADVTTTATDFSTITTTQFSTSTQWATYTGTQPNCTVPSSACTSLWEVFSQSKAVYMSWYNNMGPPESEPPWPSTPACSYCQQTNCYIQGSGKVQIYYWPMPTTAARDMCTDAPAQVPFDPWQNGNYVNTSYTPITTSGSVVMDGRTFYQGNVYLSVPAASVTNNCGSTLGNVQSNILLTVASSDIYSVRNDKAGVYSINYADFIPPHPWSAYKGALHDCASGMNFGMGPWCTRSVVFDDNFHPVIQLPISLQHLDPAWAGCKPIDALLDPPVALSTTADFLSHSYPPMALPTASLPIITSRPAPTHTPIQTSGPDGDPNQLTNAPSARTATAAPAGELTVMPPQITVGPTVLPLFGSGVELQPYVTVTRGGAPAVIDGTTVRLSDSSVTLESPSGTSTVTIPDAYLSFSIRVGGRELSFSVDGDLIAQPVILQPEDPPVTLDTGAVVSVSSGGITVMDPRTGAIQYMAFEDLDGLKSVTGVVVGGQFMTVNAQGELLYDAGKTLHTGDPAVTISGTVVSIGTAGIVLTDADGNATTLSQAGTQSAQGSFRTTMNPNLSISGNVQQNFDGTALPSSTKKNSGQALSRNRNTFFWMISCSVFVSFAFA